MTILHVLDTTAKYALSLCRHDYILSETLTLWGNLLYAWAISGMLWGNLLYAWALSGMLWGNLLYAWAISGMLWGNILYAWALSGMLWGNLLYAWALSGMLWVNLLYACEETYFMPGLSVGCYEETYFMPGLSAKPHSVCLGQGNKHNGREVKRNQCWAKPQLTLRAAVDVPSPLVHSSITPYEQNVSRTVNTHLTLSASVKQSHTVK